MVHPVWVAFSSRYLSYVLLVHTLTGSVLGKSININLPTLGILVVLALYLGSLFSSDEELADNSAFQHKYDSIEHVTKNLTMILSQTSQARDSARKEASRLKYEYDSISRARNHREEVYKYESEKYRRLYLEMTSDELSKEAERIYNEAHPVPLFDSAMEPVGVGKGPLVHLLEQNNKARHLEAENRDINEQLKIKNIENASKDFQISKYQTDSTAYAGLIQAKDTAIQVKNEELEHKDKVHRKEIRRQKLQKAVATGIAILATVAAIVF